jgi:catechol 2,3-dioxygenase-like lactoylglutathione lyase family enzyme
MIRGGYVTLQVSSVATAVRFYVETLGMKLVDERTGSAFLDAGEGFVLQLAEGPSRTDAVTFHTKVPLDEAIAIYTNRGVVFQPGTSRFHDPDGNALTLTT